MKKHISSQLLCTVTSLILALTSEPLFAQTAEPAKPVKTGNEWKMPADVFKRSRLYADSLTKILKLDATASKKVYDAYLANTKPVDEIRMGPDSEEAKKEKMKANHEAFKAEMKTILTAKQFEEYVRLDSARVPR